VLRTQFILERFYKIPRKSRRVRFREFQRKLGRWIAQESWGLALGAVTLVLLMLAHGYYYNVLMPLEQNVHFSWSKVEAGQQKRNHVGRNLTGLLRYYTHYEAEIMKDVTKLRTQEHSEPGTQLAGPDGNDLTHMLGQLHVVAEQYPLLHLQDTVQEVMRAVVSSESEISGYIIGYNEAVTVYATTLHRFPASVFGRILGFKDYQFYNPEQPAILDFAELKP
jgi:LemA protein